MRFLCVCQYGHSRSVALARQLHSLGQAAVAIGWQTSGGAIEPLAAWATHILVVDGGAWAAVPPAAAGKCLDFNVGPDRWVNPYHPELAAKFRELVQAKLGAELGLE